MLKVTSVDGTVIAYERYGDHGGDPLIVVGGATCDRAKTRPLAEGLGAHLPVVNYDRRGRGDSGDTSPYAVEREVEDIAALVDDLGDDVVLYGHSSGATLVLHAAAAGVPARAARSSSTVSTVCSCPSMDSGTAIRATEPSGAICGGGTCPLTANRRSSLICPVTVSRSAVVSVPPSVRLTTTRAGWTSLAGSCSWSRSTWVDCHWSESPVAETGAGLSGFGSPKTAAPRTIVATTVSHAAHLPRATWGKYVGEDGHRFLAARWDDGSVTHTGIT